MKKTWNQWVGRNIKIDGEELSFLITVEGDARIDIDLGCFNSFIIVDWNGLRIMGY